MGYTEDEALLSAIKNRDIVAVEAILAKNEADVNADIGMTTFLEEAIMYRRYDIMDALVKAGACINKADSNGRTALHQAARQVDPIWVTYLLARGAEVNVSDNEGKTPLHVAVHGGSFYPNCKVVQHLIDKGADLNAKDNQGRTPYDSTPMYFIDIKECLRINMEKQKRLSEIEALRNSFFILSSEEICKRLMDPNGFEEAKSAFKNDFAPLVKRMAYKDAMRAYVRIFRQLNEREKKSYSRMVVEAKRVVSHQDTPLKQVRAKDGSKENTG